MVYLSVLGLLACSALTSAQWWNSGKPNNGPPSGWANQGPAPANNQPYPQQQQGGRPAQAPYNQPQPYATPTQYSPACQISVYVYTQGGGGAQATRTQVRTHLVPTIMTSLVNGPYDDVYIEDRDGTRQVLTRTRTREHPVEFTTTAEVVKTRTIIEDNNGGAAQVITSTVTSCR